MTETKTAAEQSEAFPIYGGLWLQSCLAGAVFPIAWLLAYLGLERQNVTAALLLVLAFAFGPYIAGVILAIAVWRAKTVAFGHDGVVMKTGFFARRKAVVPWEQVVGVMRWIYGPYQESSAERGILIELTQGAMPKRRDPSIRVVGIQRDLDRLLDAMTKYSGREFRL